MNEEIKGIGDYLPKPEYGFDAISVSQIINKDILINGFEFFPTKWGEGVYILCTIGGESVKAYTHSQVLVKQAHFVAEHLPLRARVKKEGRYYTFE